MSEEFIRESNRIEGLHHDPTKLEVDKFNKFMALDKVYMLIKVRTIRTHTD